MSIIGMLFAGKAQFPPDSGWEPFSMVEDTDDYCAGKWANLILRAKKMGVDVEFTTKGIKMSKGRSEGLFKDAKGGVKLAEDFLESL